MGRSVINYYYELSPRVTTFGKHIKYVSYTDVTPEDIGPTWNKLHTEAMWNSDRVWIENANGVSFLKNRSSCSDVDLKEFMWIKLQCRDIFNL